jgi:hypothetical protein
MMTDPRVGRVIELVEALRKFKHDFDGDWMRTGSLSGWKEYRAAFDALEHDDLSNLGEIPEKVQRVVDAGRQWVQHNYPSGKPSIYPVNAALIGAVCALDAPEQKVWTVDDGCARIVCSDGREFVLTGHGAVGMLGDETRMKVCAALNLYEREQAKKP